MLKTEVNDTSRERGNAKSVHMTFVHSCGALGLCLSGYSLDRDRDFWSLIELGEVVTPRSIPLHVPLDILHPITEAFSFVVPCAFVMDIAEPALNRVGTRTVGRQPE